MTSQLEGNGPEAPNSKGGACRIIQIAAECKMYLSLPVRWEVWSETWKDWS